MPLALLIILILALLGHKKVRQGIMMRWPKNNFHPWFDLPKRKKPIWIHCSSGEFEYAKPLISKIKKQQPDWKILVTYFSPTYKKNIENFPGVDLSCPLPWDLPGAMSSFIKHHNPKAVLVARTDLWPEMLYQCKIRNIPSTIFSMTLSQPKKSIFKLYWHWLYHQFSLIFCVSQDDKNNLLDSGAGLVQVIGDTRYDQVFARLENPKPLKNLFGLHSSRICFIAGSTWSEDEKVILNSCHNFINNGKMKLIIAPHEPTESHLTDLTNQIKKLGLNYQFYSESSSWHEENVLIIDKVGILAELYKVSDMAFIGGSFKKSVHSVMEALATGCIVFVGPFHSNNREALEFKNITLETASQLNIVNTVSDQEEFSRKIHKAIESGANANDIKLEINSLIKNKMGATEKLLTWLESIEN
ncbi:MAG: hypothetical protein KDD58_05270 [Bdellovibrionales bacterium]|nr:hypothetical protein [Bdellovibrionales bacterium]